MPLKNRSRPRQLIYLVLVALALAIVLGVYGHAYP